MRQRTLLIALAVAVLVAAAGIVVALRPDEAGAQRQQQGSVVSFAAAESALGDEEAERREQIRDWARFGLAARLDVDTGGMRDAFFDAFPIRDNGFGDLASALYRGDTLHLLVPRDDVNDKRTAGLLQAVRFGNVGAMIGQHEIFLSPPGHQWSTRVLETLDGKAIHVDQSSLHRVSTRKLTMSEVLNSPSTTIHLNESFRATLSTKDGPVAADALNQDMTVTVREVTADQQQAVPADARGCGD